MMVSSSWVGKHNLSQLFDNSTFATDGTWTNYIYAAGQKIAKVDSSEVRLHLSGVNQHVSSGYRASMAMATSNARTIQPGDTLYFRQYQHNAHGGMYINFYYGEEAIVDVYDQNGEVISDASPQNQWEPRWVPLDGSTGGGNYVGKTIVNLNAINEVNAPDGAFDMYFADVAIVNRLTGEVWPVLDAGASGEITPAGQVWPADNENGYGPVYSLPLGNEGAVTNVVGAVEKSSTDPSGQPVAATHYYLDDHLGTAQVELSSGGWPVWQGQFTPFGAELDQQFTAMHYKFTGKERDAESGLDFFGARYYASTAGRWMSPDWAAKPEAVPYSSLDDPQSLNLYSYVYNNPLSRADADGHWPQWLKSVATGAGKWFANQITGGNVVLSRACPACGEATGVRDIVGNNIATYQSPSNTAEAVGYYGAAVAQVAAAVIPGFGGETTVSAAAPLLETENVVSTSLIQANAAQGAAWEDAVGASLKQTDPNTASQVTLETQSGVRTRMDFVSKDASGNVSLTEAKSSATAPLTPNQAAAHPEIANTGATVVGQGKPGYPGGTQIPPTPVNVVRPPQ